MNDNDRTVDDIDCNSTYIVDCWILHKVKKQMNFYKSKQWIKKRERILRRDNYECRECKRYGKTTPANTVHHIYPLEDNPEYRLTTANLLSLCMSCHGTFHDRVTNALTDKGLKWKEKVVLPPIVHKA